ncbi:MAG: hypothetical protein C0184_15785 [Chloroflexus aggregans]|uniref:Cas12f1-like TNB domain-containing protein n=3 Tax=Chloroflexus TaxID=1107 RepID=A0A2J6WT24_9CHLR|nr:MAG: hypothetical protein C0184_15785 [Chloroflexus aggregans]
MVLAVDAPVPKDKILPRMNPYEVCANLDKTIRKDDYYRNDVIYMLITRDRCENQAMVVEHVSVAGMTANKPLAHTIGNVGVGLLHTQIASKTTRSGGQMMCVEDRYPRTYLCSSCRRKDNMLMVCDWKWLYPHCGTIHDRDHKVAHNRKQPATAPLLPEAKLTGNSSTVSEKVQTETLHPSDANYVRNEKEPCALLHTFLRAVAYSICHTWNQPS